MNGKPFTSDLGTCSSINFFLSFCISTSGADEENKM